MKLLSFCSASPEAGPSLSSTLLKSSFRSRKSSAILDQLSSDQSVGHPDSSLFQSCV